MADFVHACLNFLVQRILNRAFFEEQQKASNHAHHRNDHSLEKHAAEKQGGAQEDTEEMLVVLDGPFLLDFIEKVTEKGHIVFSRL